MKPHNPQHKKDMLAALEKSLGVVTTAAKAANIDRSTHYGWMREDPEYKASVDALNDLVLDFLESKAHKLVEQGDTSMTIFMLKCKGKKRGYIERQEITGAEDAPPLQIIISERI